MTEPLSGMSAELLLRQVPGWRLASGHAAIIREFRFSGFRQVVDFINAIAWIAHHQGHHPDIRAGRDYCQVRFTTHAIDGLSDSDFVCATRVNALREN